MACNVMTVPEVARVLRIGKAAAYLAVRRGDLPCVIRVGKRILVPETALEDFLRNAGRKSEPGGVGNE